MKRAHKATRVLRVKRVVTVRRARLAHKDLRETKVHKAPKETPVLRDLKVLRAQKDKKVKLVLRVLRETKVLRAPKETKAKKV